MGSVVNTAGSILLPGGTGKNSDWQGFYRKAQDPGGVFNEGGSFQATAPTIDYQPQTSDYSGTLAQAQQQALTERGAGAAASQAALAQRLQQGDGSSATEARQTALADMLQQQAEGKGPSLAQLQLQQATQANNSQAASAIASQRGINPALAARMIMQNQAAANQQAAAQSAQLRMQEQMGARTMLGSALSAQRGQDISQQQANTQRQGLAAQLLSQQRGQDISQQQMYGQLLGTAGNLQQGQNQIGLQQAAENARLKMQAQQINAGIATANAQAQQGMLGGLLGGMGAAAAQKSSGGGGGDSGSGGGDTAGAGDLGGDGSTAYAYRGGEVRGYAYGGETEIGDVGKSDIGEIGTSLNKDEGINVPEKKNGLGGLVSTVGSIASLFQHGGRVPGRASLPGDHLENDTVDAKLSPGEIVLPRSVTQTEDAPERAAKFVEAIRQHQPSGYARLLEQRRDLAQRLARVNEFLERKPR